MFTKKRCFIAAAIISNALVGLGVHKSYSSINQDQNVAMVEPSVEVSFDVNDNIPERVYTASGGYYTIDTTETDYYTNPIYGIVDDTDYYVSKPKLEHYEIDFASVNDDVICLAQNIYHEARGEEYEGKVLVGQVTLNRVKSHKWRDTICGVVYQKYQFEWVGLEMFMDMSTQKERNSFMESIVIAQGVIDGSIPDISKNADHYYNPKVVKREPSWPSKMTLVQVVGNHKFYQDK